MYSLNEFNVLIIDDTFPQLPTYVWLPLHKGRSCEVDQVVVPAGHHAGTGGTVGEVVVLYSHQAVEVSAYHMNGQFLPVCVVYYTYREKVWWVRFCKIMYIVMWESLVEGKVKP